jgi:hypothetical protein
MTTHPTHRTHHAASPARRTGPWPAVALAAGTAGLVFGILLLASSWLRAQREGGSPPHRRPDAAARDVDVWVGELAPGVEAVLSSEWNDPEADARYDEALNRDLGVPAVSPLAYYRLTVQNRTEKPVTLDLRDGCLVVTPPAGGPLPVKSLASLLSGGAGSGPASAQAGTLRALGAARESVEVPPGTRHRHVVALEKRIPLSSAVAVARADGTGFRARRIPGRRWDDFLESPSKPASEDGPGPWEPR